MKPKKNAQHAMPTCDPADGVNLPEAPDIERAVLGALLLEGEKIADVRGSVAPEAFADPIHRRIYDAMLSLDNSGSAIDVVSVMGELKASTGAPVNLAYLADLSNAVGSGTNCATYARRLQEIYTRRRLAIFGHELVARTVLGHDSVMEWATQQVAAIGDGAVRAEDMRPIGNILSECLRLLEERQQAATDGRATGVSTGLQALDAVLGGWGPGQLIVVAGRPGMGKSAAALHFMLSAARTGVATCFFSMEMQSEQLVDRMIVGCSGADADAYRTGRGISTQVWANVEDANTTLSALPIHICDSSTMSMEQIRAQCRRMHRRGLCNLAVIDYLQLIDCEDRAASREREVAQMSRSAKRLARELNIPVILLAQLSRRVEERVDKVPMLSDLRESGAIEQDADIVAFVHRPEYYGIATIETSRYGIIPSDGIGRFILAKNRSGRTGSVYFRFNKSLTRITDYDTMPTAQGEADAAF